MHDACTSGTSRVLTLASLQRLKMEALIPASADCDKVFECNRAQHRSKFIVSCARSMCARLDGQHISCRSSAGRCLITIHLIPRTSHQISIFSYTSNSCPVSDRHFQNDSEAEMSVTVVPMSGGRLLRHRDTKLVPLYEKCLNFGGEYVEK